MLRNQPIRLQHPHEPRKTEDPQHGAADVGDSSQILEALESHAQGEKFYQEALSSIDISVEQPPDSFSDSINRTINLL